MDMHEGELSPRLEKRNPEPAPMRGPGAQKPAPGAEKRSRDAPFPWMLEEKENGTQPPVPAY